MTKKLVLVAMLALMLVATPILASCAKPEPTPTPKPTPTPTEKPTGEVIIGHFADITGPTASSNLGFKMALDIYIPYINDVKGGIEGDKGIAKIKMETVDTQYAVPKGKEGWERLKDKGMDCAFTALGAMAEGLWPDCEKDKIPMVTASVGMRSVYSDWIFLGSHNGFPNCTATWINGMIEIHKREGKTGLPKVGAIGPDAPYAPMFFVGVQEFAKSVGYDSFPVEIYPMDSTDISAQLKRLRAQGVENVFNFSPPPQQVITMKSIDRLGIRDELKNWILYNANMADVMGLGGKDLVEGCGAVYWFVPATMTPDIPRPPGLKQASELWDKANPGKPISELYLFCVPQVLIMEEAIRLALNEVTPDQITGETLKKYGLEQIKNFDPGGLCHTITYEAGVVPHDYGTAQNYWTVHDGVLYPALGDDIEWVTCVQIIPPPE